MVKLEGGIHKDEGGRLMITYNQEVRSIHEWGYLLGLEWKTIWARLDKGRSIEDALSKSIARRKPERKKVITKACLNCSSDFIIPKSRDWREHCCSSECKARYRELKSKESLAKRARKCKECGVEFSPRANQIRNGQGIFCSNKCHMESGELTLSSQTEESKAKSLKTLLEGIESGRTTYKRGGDNPCWKGGARATTARRHEKAMIYQRMWRAKNKDKAREQALRRRGRTIGRLERGTIKALKCAQKMKCAICRKSLKTGFHVDHIMPLAKGGLHEKHNIQLLCPTCNVRKSAKDPIDYMQERGFLL